MQWQYMHIFNVLNAKIHILEEEKIVLKQWVNNKQEALSIPKNLFVPIVAIFQLKIVLNMEKILFSSNVSSVARLLNGFVGETPISVNLATKDKLMEIMSVKYQNKNYPNVKVLVNALQEEIMDPMVNKKV